jgi:hypothetical protein
MKAFGYGIPYGMSLDNMGDSTTQVKKRLLRWCDCCAPVLYPCKKIDNKKKLHTENVQGFQLNMKFEGESGINSHYPFFADAFTDIIHKPLNKA